MPEPTVIIITDAVLKLADDAAGLATGEAWECQTTSCAINATPNLQTVPATFCSPSSQAPAATGYELAITWLQDWTAPGGGLSMYAYNNDTLTKAFSLTLNGATEPMATGTVRVVAGSYGGDAGVPLTATAVWPCPVKPTITAPADVLATTASGPEGEADAEPAYAAS